MFYFSLFSFIIVIPGYNYGIKNELFDDRNHVKLAKFPTSSQLKCKKTELRYR